MGFLGKAYIAPRVNTTFVGRVNKYGIKEAEGS